MRSLITAQLLVGSCELKFWFWRISRDFSENFGRGYPQILEVDVLKKYITQVDVGICRATPREGEQIVGGSRRIMKNPHKGFSWGMYLVQTSSDV